MIDKLVGISSRRYSPSHNDDVLKLAEQCWVYFCLITQIRWDQILIEQKTITEPFQNSIIDTVVFYGEFWFEMTLNSIIAIYLIHLRIELKMNRLSAFSGLVVWRPNRGKKERGELLSESCYKEKWNMYDVSLFFVTHNNVSPNKYFWGCGRPTEGVPISNTLLHLVGVLIGCRNPNQNHSLHLGVQI